MAEASIASAVALPEDDVDISAQQNGTKRRLSEAVEGEKEQESKRQRTSPGKNSQAATRRDSEAGTKDTETQSKDGGKAEDLREARRKSSVADEKQRSKRLFGALLGSLNQPKDRTTKRRQEIESRRKAELQRQDDERVEDKQRRKEKLEEQRSKVAVKVDEENMRMRHRNMLDAANYLQTNAEPRIYYKPWDLRPDEEDRIEEQIRDTKAQIDKELDDFDGRQGRDSREREQVDSPEPPRINARTKATAPTAPNENESNGPDTKMTDGGDQVPDKSTNETAKSAEVPESPTDNATTNPVSASPKATQNVTEEPQESKEEEMEDDGEHVDGDEDAVIY